MKKLYKITKLGKVDNPVHKFSDYGNIPRIGQFTKQPTIGERFELYPIGWKPELAGISTSPITEIIDEFTFKTLNSIYKIEEYKEN